MSDLSLKIQIRAFDKASKPFENIRKVGGKLGRSFDNNLKAFKKLDAQMSDVRAYQKQAKAVQQSNQKLTKLQEKAKDLQIALKNSSGSNQSIKQANKLRSEYNRTRAALDKLSLTQVGQRKKLASTAIALKKAGISTKNLGDTQGVLNSKAQSLNKTLTEQSQKLTTLSQKQSNLEKMRKIRDKRLARSANASMAGYVGVNAGRQAARGLANPVMEYMRQEEAVTDLKITMMRSDGSTGEFKKLSEKVKMLGVLLPGTAEDFIRLGEALKKQGLKDNVLLNGGLENAAKLNVLMKMGQEEGGTFTARMIEAHGLKETELAQAADLTQRAHFAYGIKKEDMAESMKYYAPRVNTLGLTGQDNYKQLLAIQGMAARKGLEGSMFGTNFSMVLGKLAEGPKAIAMAKKGMKAEAGNILEKAGVKLDFFNADGSLKSIKNVVKEMEKIDVIREKLGEKDMLIAMKQIFGEQGGRVAQIIAQGGVDGLEAAMAEMDLQADMDTRIAEKTSTLGAAFEQFGGVLTLIQGVIGGALREDLKAWVDMATQFVAKTLKPWVEKNKGLVKGLMLAAAAFSALAVIGGGFLLVFAGVNSAWTIACFLLKGLPMLLMGVARAMMANPIMLIIMAIAAGAYLIYKNWDGISAFFKNLWSNVTTWFSDTWALLRTDTLGGLAKIGAAILNWSPLGLVYKAFAGVMNYFDIEMPDSLTGFLSETGTKIGAAILNWSPLGLVYKAFAGVMNYFDIEMPDSLTGFLSETGTKIMNAIMSWTPVKWLTDVFSGAIDTVGNMLDGLANRFGIISNEVNGLTAQNIGKGPASTAGAALSAASTAKGLYGIGKKLNDGGADKIIKWSGADKLLAKIQSVKAATDQMQKQPFTIKQDANKTMNYNGQFAINVQTDGSVMSTEVSRLVQVHAQRYFAQQEALNRRALHDTD